MSLMQEQPLNVNVTRVKLLHLHYNQKDIGPFISLFDLENIYNYL